MLVECGVDIARGRAVIYDDRRARPRPQGDGILVTLITQNLFHNETWEVS